MKRLRFRQYLWILPVCLILTSMIGYFLAKAQPPVYQVSAVLFVDGQGSPSNPFAQPLSSGDAIGVANNDAAEVTSRNVMLYVTNTYDKSGVLKKAGYSSDDLLADISAVASSTAPTISITASALSPNDTVTLSNLVANGYVAYSQNQIQQQVDQLRTVLQNQLNTYNQDKQNWEQQIVKVNNPSDPVIGIYQTNLQDDVHNIDLIEQQLLQLPTVVTPNIRVIQQASPADVTPVSKTSVIVGASALVGLLVGMAIMLTLIFLDNRLHSEEDVKEKLGLAYLGGLSPNSQIKTPAHLTGISSQQIADIFTNLHLTGVLSGERRTPHGAVLLVTSAQTAEGKSSVSVALAASAARSGSTVVVVDGNLRQPATHLVFGMGVASIGLSGLLKMNGSVDDAVQRSKVQNVWLLAGGTPVEDPGPLIEQNLSGVLAALRKKTDLVIIDGPALLSGADASVIATMADGVVLVVDTRHAKIPMLLRVKELLVSLTHKPTGVVMNRFALRKRNQYFATPYDGATVMRSLAVEMNGNGDNHGNVNGQKLEVMVKNEQQPEPVATMAASVGAMPPLPASFAVPPTPVHSASGTGALDISPAPPPSPRDFPRSSAVSSTPPPLTGGNGGSVPQNGRRIPPTPPYPVSRRPDRGGSSDKL